LNRLRDGLDHEAEVFDAPIRLPDWNEGSTHAGSAADCLVADAFVPEQKRSSGRGSAALPASNSQPNDASDGPDPSFAVTSPPHRPAPEGQESNN
jgi:hypothetical protein